MFDDGDLRLAIAFSHKKVGDAYGGRGVRAI